MVCCLETQRYPDSGTDIRAAVRGPSTQEDARIHQIITGKVIGSPLGHHVCVLIFFLLLGHMLLTRFSAQRKKEYWAMVMGTGEPGKVLMRREAVKPQTTHRRTIKSQTEWEVTLSLSPEVREGSQQSLSISAGSGICETAWTLLCQQEVG